MYSLILCGLFHAGILFGQDPQPQVSIVLKLMNPQGQTLNNIDLPLFSFHFENNTAQPCLFETTPNYTVKTERLRYRLTDPGGKIHTVTPPVHFQRTPDDGSNYTILYPGEKSKRVRHEMQRTLEAHFWEWWQDLLWAPGEYRLQVLYIPDPDGEYGNPRVVHDSIFSNPLSFVITPTPAYLPEPPHQGKADQGYIRGLKSGDAYRHIRYTDAEGQVTAERIFLIGERHGTMPVFELVYDHPVPATDSLAWRRVRRVLHCGHSYEYVLFWMPVLPSEQIDGFVRTWNAHAPGGRRGQPLAEARYENGLLDGPIEAYLDGMEVSGAYAEGKEEGPWTVWVDGELLFRVHFMEGRFQGPYYLRHVNSKTTWKAGSYVKGKRHGAFETFHPNGQLEKHAEYVSDTLSGFTMVYDEEGREVAKGVYVNGKPYNGTFVPERIPRAAATGGPWFIKQPEVVEYKEGVPQMPEEKEGSSGLGKPKK